MYRNITELYFESADKVTTPDFTVQLTYSLFEDKEIAKLDVRSCSTIIYSRERKVGMMHESIAEARIAVRSWAEMRNRENATAYEEVFDSCIVPMIIAKNDIDGAAKIAEDAGLIMYGNTSMQFHKEAE